MTPFFDYVLPPDLIAQEPAAVRDESRLLVVRANADTFEHRIFRDLPDLLEPGDLLIRNNTRVVPARLRGIRKRTGGKWEGLFLRQVASGQWEMMLQTRGTFTPGETLIVESNSLRVALVQKTPEGHWLVEPDDRGPPETVLARCGEMPLPPYIRKGRARETDLDRYQTVFASQVGAVAAPTAGLHFTPELFDRLKSRGVELAEVTLHVGLGTFQPIREDGPDHHQMHAEWGELPESTVEAIRQCRQRRGRVAAVGTTAVRVLESVAAEGDLAPWRGETALFIRPPFRFRVVDLLITNFHLPRSTLLLLVAAFGGSDRMRAAYEAAIAAQYRFYSYGDAMLIERHAEVV